MKPGENSYVQSSVDSSVTIPFEQTYRDVAQMNPMVQYATRFCGCGWPHNLLIPRGKPEGMPCTLLVMVSDYELDKVGDNLYMNINTGCSNEMYYPLDLPDYKRN